MKKLMACVLVVALLTPTLAVGHDGLVNAQGCHTDNDGTNYHCHPERVKSKEVVIKTDAPGDDEEEAIVEQPRNQRRSNSASLAGPPITYYSNSGGTTFNHTKANKALKWSVTTVGTASLLGAFMAAGSAAAMKEHNSNNPEPVLVFSTVFVSGILSGLSASSLYSLQAGLDASSKPIGLTMVILSAIAPVLVGLAY